MSAKAAPTNILLVDDRPEGLLALEAALRSPDYTLVQAGSGSDALKRLLERDFAVILLDVQMPDLDGYETAALIRARERSRAVPIIFITATSREDPSILRGYESGAVDYILKPFDVGILRSKVRIFVDIHRQGLEIRRQAELIREAERQQREQLLARLELESFQRYRDLAEAMPHMVWRSNPEGGVDYFNRLWCEYTGLSLEQSAGTGWQAQVEPADLKRIRELWDVASRKGDAGFETECRVRGKDGAQRWHAFRAVAQKSRSGRLEAWIGTITDIHVRKEAEEKLKQARELALEASRMKSEFLANISHEIRTPINGITGMATLLGDTPLNVEQREYVRTVLTSSNTLLSIVNDVLDFSKIEAGKLSLEESDFPLRPVIDDLAGLMEPKTREKKLALVTYVDPKLPALVRGDSRRIGQILLNLVGNAIKFTERGSVIVRANLESTRDDGRVQVRFSVSDTGIGVPEEARARLFLPFSQADGSTARKYGGTGLGLSISKDLCELMGGAIGHETRPEGGSTFWFTLPFLPAAGPLPSPFPRHGLENIRVLVADDDPAVLQILRSYFDSWQVRCDCVSSGEEALASLRFGALVHDPYDVVLLDNVMPGMGGIEAARRIREDRSIAATHVILLSADHDGALESLAREAGVKDCLYKPFRQTRLLESLQEATKRRLKASS